MKTDRLTDLNDPNDLDDLNFLREWREPIPRARIAAAIVGAILYHLAAIAVVLLKVSERRRRGDRVDVVVAVVDELDAAVNVTFGVSSVSTTLSCTAKWSVSIVMVSHMAKKPSMKAMVASMPTAGSKGMLW